MPDRAQEAQLLAGLLTEFLAREATNEPQAHRLPWMRRLHNPTVLAGA